MNTVELFDALTERLADILAANLEYTDKTGYGDREQSAAGVARVVRITETLEPTYEDPVARSLEIGYIDQAGQERTHYLWEVSVAELLHGTGVHVPGHKLTWTLTAEGGSAA